MPVSLTIEHSLFPIHRTEESLGVRLPWEVASYVDDARTCETRGGFFDLSAWNVVRIAGPDARDFLNRMSTVDFKKFDGHSVPWGCFLTGRGLVVTLGHFLAAEDGFDYVVAPPQGTTALEHIEKFHFAENLIASDVSGSYALFGIWKPSSSVSQWLGLSTTEVPLRLVKGNDGMRAWRDDYRPDLWWVRVARASAVAFIERLRALDVPLLGHRLFEYHRIRTGAPAVGREISEKEIVLEASLDRAVARNKGCYPGQEVVERIYTYGSVNRKLLPVEVRMASAVPSLPILLKDGEKPVGNVVSLAEIPGKPGQADGLAYVHRLYWEKTDPLPTVDPELVVTIRRID